MRRLLVGTGVLILILAAPPGPHLGATPSTVVPLARAHAHNDYQHPRPLRDALDRGFTSVEADVWLVEGNLLVAHDRREARQEWTLRTLYLEPLRRIIVERGGRIYPGYPFPLMLLVDIKSEAEATYRALDAQLRAYGSLLVVASVSGVRVGPVLVVISGNRPKQVMLGQATRRAGYDGRLADLGGSLPASFMPLVSDNWLLHFAWMGGGPMPESERRKLRAIVEAAHARRQRVRFWATPDAPGAAAEMVWTELLRAGVDYITTDRLEALQQFLLRADPSPSTPPIR